jgi:hypothetical protein
MMMMMMMSMAWDYISELQPSMGLWVWRTVVDDVKWKKLPICPPEHSSAILSTEPSSKLGTCGQRNDGSYLRNISFKLTEIFTCCKKSYNMVPLGLLPLRRKVWCIFFRPSKSITLAGSEPANLGSSGTHTNHYTTDATTDCSYFEVMMFQYIIIYSYNSCFTADAIWLDV